MKLRNIIFEGFEPATSIVNGKTYSVDWLGSTDTLEEFKKLLHRVPDTIKSIEVPTNLKNFQSGNDLKSLEPRGNWKEDVLNIIQTVIDNDKSKTVDRFILSSYFGISHMPGKNNTDPIYVQLDSQSSRDFGADMSSGKYGPLD
tara:strand:- start:1358 stop:1789 length:432 start_codon:yes stop_codon:yes gene_type:complete